MNKRIKKKILKQKKQLMIETIQRVISTTSIGFVDGDKASILQSEEIAKRFELMLQKEYPDKNITVIQNPIDKDKYICNITNKPKCTNLKIKIL
jgi:hypothetical protein